jgi:hypothetical protein
MLLDREKKDKSGWIYIFFTSGDSKRESEVVGKKGVIMEKKTKQWSG